MTWVDVIIPCYNYGKFLERCVESVLLQPIEVRVLVIDDASSDQTATIAAELVRRDQRVHFIRHMDNRGHIDTYNEGLHWASADYLLLLSADDVLAPNALIRAAELMDQQPEIGLTYGRAPVFQSDEELPVLLSGMSDVDWQVISGADYLRSVCASASNRTPTATAVVRTRLQKRLGGYRRELPHSGDMEMWLRFAAHGPVAFRDAPQAFRRIHGQNMELGYLGKDVGDLPERKAAFDLFFQDYGANLPDAGRLHQQAIRAIAEIAFWRASEAFDRGDLGQYRIYLEFALEVFPMLVTWPAWWRLTLKRILGPRSWSQISPLVERVRRQRNTVRSEAQYCE